MFRYADQSVCETELGAAGFLDVALTDLDLVFPVQGLEYVVTFLESAGVRSRGLFTAQSPDQRHAILAAIDAQLRRSGRHLDGAGRRSAHHRPQTGLIATGA